MRFNGIALVAGAMAIVACAGGEKKTETTTTTTDTTAAAATTTSTTTATAGSSTAMAPITGKTVEVKMIGDGTTYKFEPAEIELKQGDGVKFIMVSGGPHNVAFIDTPAAAQAQLSANMPQQMKELTSPMMMTANETYTVSFANVPVGTYNFHCEPHAAMGMKGKITVK
ncbi:MAG TPA: plastocyanin/azurin family copper-binding protein [Gemmatimonadaceae bacterium]|nr:plastocyanin/azurin family copper-binding protein [Gemmatimonadaceae bacterium]